VNGRTVILVDDGLATGASIRAAALALKRLGLAWLVVAAPVGSRAACSQLETMADEVVCSRMPEPFYAVGQFYEDFGQTSDEEVRALLERARRERQPHAAAR
jgi:putative phosphoribosyl transferase